jgi:hypothetical protein
VLRLVVALLLAAGLAGPLAAGRLPAAHAAEWGQIRPGTSTRETVRARFGEPTQVDRTKEQGYDLEDWVYEGAQAPVGMIRLVVHYGLLTDGAFKPEVVRGFRLEPKRGSFNRKLIIDGWGAPDRQTQQDNEQVLLFRQGLLVYLHEDGQARLMVFSLPQPISKPAATPR